ncbi:hypothetical protein AHAS_Ahas12G0152600 [Arachis hypogaea]
MFDKTAFAKANGLRRTYTDLVMHGSLELHFDSETEEEESEESSEDEEEDNMEEVLEMSQFQRQALKKMKREERITPSISAK